MARGWESKSVEEQQAEAQAPPQRAKSRLTSSQLARERHKEGLLLSRTRLLQQLAAAQNPRHRDMLQAALADLDSKLTQLD